MNTNQEKVIRYYQNPGTKLGFDFFLWGSKHFGFYPSGQADISEREAQVLLQEKVANYLDLHFGQIVLDAGCGQGVVSAYLAKKYGARIFGITLVPFEVEKARRRAVHLGVADITDYQIMDYSATTFADNYFDAIYTTETLSHSPDIRKTLGEFFRILKPGGRLALFEYTVAPREKFSPQEIEIFDLVAEHSAMMGLKDFKHDQFVSVMQDAGFAHAKERNITKNVGPSFYRLHRISRVPYMIIRLLRLQKFFINTTAGYEYYKMAEKDLIRYCIFTATKPE
jgi:sterol 24-C-methyltransferase